jgi:hypothetical protein
MPQIVQLITKLQLYVFLKSDKISVVKEQITLVEFLYFLNIRSVYSVEVRITSEIFRDILYTCAFFWFYCIS